MLGCTWKVASHRLSPPVWLFTDSDYLAAGTRAVALREALMRRSRFDREPDLTDTAFLALISLSFDLRWPISKWRHVSGFSPLCIRFLADFENEWRLSGAKTETRIHLYSAPKTCALARASDAIASNGHRHSKDAECWQVILLFGCLVCGLR